MRVCGPIELPAMHVLAVFRYSPVGGPERVAQQ
jgi:hypothetical protein